MSLATTCPQCKTSFKVVPDQLKLRRGLVRCGICRHVFSGVDFLHYIEDTSGPRAARQPSPAAAAAPLGDALPPLGLASARREPSARTTTPLPDDDEDDALDARALASPLETPATDRWDAERDTAILDVGDFDAPDTEPIDRADTETRPRFEPAFVDERAAPADLPGSSRADAIVAHDAGDTLPLAAAAADAAARTDAAAVETGSPEEDAVDFFSTNERAGGFATRSTVFAAMAAFVLGIALALQLAIGARDWLASAVPALRPALAASLAPLGLSIRPPRQIDALTIESFELQSAGGSGLLAMSALLRNAVGHPVRWPAMELSLTDGTGAVVVRKVLLPADYLTGASRGEGDGVAANAEWPIRVALQPQGVEPTAYSVKLFYP